MFTTQDTVFTTRDSVKYLFTTPDSIYCFYYSRTVFLPDKLNLFLSFFLFAGNTKYLVFFSRPRSKWETKKTKTILVRAFAQKPFRKYATMLTQLKKSTSIKKMTIVHACVSAVAPSARILGAHCAGRVPFLRVGARTGSSVRTPGAASHEIAGRVTTCAGAVGADALRAVPVCRGAGPVWQRLQPVDPLQPASQHVQVGESHFCVGGLRDRGRS